MQDRTSGSYEVLKYSFLLLLVRHLLLLAWQLLLVVTLKYYSSRLPKGRSFASDRFLHSLRERTAPHTSDLLPERTAATSPPLHRRSPRGTHAATRVGRPRLSPVNGVEAVVRHIAHHSDGTHALDECHLRRVGVSPPPVPGRRNGAAQPNEVLRCLLYRVLVPPSILRSSIARGLLFRLGCILLTCANRRNKA